MSHPYDDRITRRLVDGVLPEALPAFLPTQRWFGAKARAIARVSVHDLAWLTGEPHRNALALVDIQYASGAPDRYALVVGLREDPGALPVIQRPSGDDELWAVEAAGDHEGCHALLAGFGSTPGLPTLRGGTLRFADVTDLTVHAVTAGVAVRPVGAEQSNSSMRVGPDLVFKLLRRIEDGENPEIEITRFLTTKTAFRAMPALQGSLSYEGPDGAAGSIGVAQAWVESRGDGWNHVLHTIESHLRGERPIEGLQGDLVTLGAITADFHAAMASDAAMPGFEPEPAAPPDLAAWARQIESQAAGAVSLLAHAPLDDDLRMRLEVALSAFVGTRSTVVPHLGQSAGDGFPKIRIHGDYHLGQTLKTATGFVLLDFEGEPTRSLEERRRKHSALKDVAGMLRSFEYAVETACATAQADVVALATALDARGRFLAGYEEAALRQPRPVVPANAEARHAWIRFLELEKALYELAYEINNRPAWAHIPARGILRLLEA